MISSFTVFACGGALLGWFEHHQAAWAGFFILMLLAAGGRGLSALQLKQMHDPDHASAARPVEDGRCVRQLVGIGLGQLARRVHAA